jgi:hypothetical protein
LEVLLKEELFIKRRKLEGAGRKTGLRVRVRERTISSRVASYKKVHFWPLSKDFQKQHINENGEFSYSICKISFSIILKTNLIRQLLIKQFLVFQTIY